MEGTRHFTHEDDRSPGALYLRIRDGPGRNESYGVMVQRVFIELQTRGDLHEPAEDYTSSREDFYKPMGRVSEEILRYEMFCSVTILELSSFQWTMSVSFYIIYLFLHER